MIGSNIPMSQEIAVTHPTESDQIPLFPSPAPVEQTPENPSKKKFWTGFLAGAGSAALVAGLVGASMAIVNKAGEPDVFDITGIMTVNGDITYSSLTGFECEGDGGYSDMSPAAAVSVSDESGKLLAKGTLTGSTKLSDSCMFDFTVTDVPRGSTFYEVEISHRGGLSYTEEEAESGLSLSLGD